MNYITEEVHIRKIESGDTILHNGKETTVCANNITHNFMGKCLFGDSYHSGHKPVIRIHYKSNRIS